MGLGDAYDRVLWRQGRDPQVENPCSIRWLLDWIILEILYFVARTEEPCLVFQFPFYFTLLVDTVRTNKWFHIKMKTRTKSYSFIPF